MGLGGRDRGAGWMVLLILAKYIYIYILQIKIKFLHFALIMNLKKIFSHA